jgi:hypothetical protein
VKRTHKLSAIANAADVIAAAPSLSAAAKQLGVDRSTIHRWIESGKVKLPARRKKPGAKVSAPPSPTTSPDAWAAWVRETYELDSTGKVLVDLSVSALLMANDVTASRKDKLSAMGRFQQLVKQLNLEGADLAGAAAPVTPARAARPARARGSVDPRGILAAVKS